MPSCAEMSFGGPKKKKVNKLGSTFFVFQLVDIGVKNP
jgi:hypothetical protein